MAIGYLCYHLQKHFILGLKETVNIACDVNVDVSSVVPVFAACSALIDAYTAIPFMYFPAPHRAGASCLPRHLSGDLWYNAECLSHRLVDVKESGNSGQ